jgi:hypothetical protein
MGSAGFSVDRRCGGLTLDYTRKNRLILMMTARLRVAGNLGANVSRSSLKTTNSSLPGRYSHRRRTFAEMLFVLELNWINALANISGVIV